MQGHRRILALVAAAGVAGTLGATSASAQVDARDALARCRSLPTEEERLDCMEELVLDLSSTTPSPSSGGADAAAPDMPPSPEQSDTLGARDEPVTPLVERSASGEAAADREPQSYGSEYLQARDAEESRSGPLTAQVVAFEEIPYQRLRVELDNGQVWEQRGNDPVWRIEQYGAPDQVEISPSGFGGYRMRLIGSNLALSVKRVR